MRRNLVHLDGAAVPHYYDYRIRYLEQSTSSESTKGWVQTGVYTTWSHLSVTWAEAQGFYEAGGGPRVDRHRLDGDNDGVPCESLAGVP